MQSESRSAEDDSRRLVSVWPLVVCSVLWAVLWFVHTFHYWEDDAWIHLEFARSLSRGQGFAFNGHVVYGDTSPLWVWLLLLVHVVVPSWLAAGKLLSACCAGLALWGAFKFAESLVITLGRTAARRFAAGMLLVFVANPYFAYWAFSGMEALAAAGLVCWALVAISGSSREKPITPLRFLLACACGGIAPLLRPEMSFFTFLLGLVLFVRWANLPSDAGKKIVLFLAGLALLLGPGVGWAVYAVHVFGAILPNTNAAKRAGPDESIVRHLLQIYTFGYPLVLLGTVALGAWFVQDRRRSSHSQVSVLARSLNAGGWLLFCWTALNCLFYVVDHTYVQTRYIFVTAPVLTIALLAIARKLRPQWCQAGVIFGVVFGIVISLLSTWPLINNKVQVDRDYADLASFLRTLPPDAPVAHYSIGEAAFLSEHPIVDLGGITRPGVIPFLWDASDDRRIWWTHEQGARYMIIDHQPEPGALLVWRRSIPTTGWFLDPRHFHRKELLLVWKLPPSPTLPLPPNLPANDQP